MRKVFHAVLLAAGLASWNAPAAAHDYVAGAVRIDHPYSAPTPPAARVAGVWFVSLSNDGRQADRLVGAETPIAERVEIHTMRMDGEVMRMREIGAIDLAPGQRIAMRPQAGEHLMLMNLKRPLKAGDRFPLTLRFEQGGTVEVSVHVETPRAGGAPMPEHRH